MKQDKELQRLAREKRHLYRMILLLGLVLVICTILFALVG
ncbi:hypothetical protein VCSRO160_1567 [Vibrio cholerae]|jgi:hypothetical protein|nr:hypothetical protein VCSRO160_1567 [Vibrio cholerae]